MQIEGTSVCGHSADTKVPAAGAGDARDSRGTSVMGGRRTDAVVKVLPRPAEGSRIFYDDVVKGFGVRITAGGARAFILNYRPRLGRERRYTIGVFPEWKTSAARAQAIEL